MSKDHILVSCITREGELLNALRRNLPNVRAVHVPHTSLLRRVSRYYFDEEDRRRRAADRIMAAFGTRVLHQAPLSWWDDDVDIFDTQRRDVRWRRACGPTRTSSSSRAPGRDPRPDLGPGEFHRDQVGIDATRPAGAISPSGW